MEIDLIFLPRNKEMTIQDIEKDFTQIINTMFTNVSDTSFDVTTTSSNVCNYKVDYKYKVEKDRILYIKIQSDLSEMKSAELLDLVANKITKGSHRKKL